VGGDFGDVRELAGAEFGVVVARGDVCWLG
jgi:hypothetical protein